LLYIYYLLSHFVSTFQSPTAAVIITSIIIPITIPAIVINQNGIKSASDQAPIIEPNAIGKEIIRPNIAHLQNAGILNLNTG
jgi:hypothetical protein